MNTSRRKFFGLATLPAIGLMPTAAMAETRGEVKVRGEFTDNGLLAYPDGKPAKQKFTMIHLSLPQEMGGQQFETTRLVEVEIGGKREYVLTFEEIKKIA